MSKGKTTRGGKQSRGHPILSFFVGMFAIAALVYFAYCMSKIAGDARDKYESRKAYERIEDAVVHELVPSDYLHDETEVTPAEGETEAEPIEGPVIGIDWDKFEGSDIVGWIQMDEKVNYPIMQAESNDYYLHRLYNIETKSVEDNYGGSIFLYNHNSPLFTDQSSFVYGHNMRDESMFGSLRNYKTEEFSDHCFYIYTPDGNRRTYRFFSVASVLENSKTYTWSFASDDSFLEWQQYMKDQSMFPNLPQISKDAHYVTLSTCNGSSGTNYRFVVCGQLMRIDRVQEPASWYGDYVRRRGEAVDAKHEHADQVRSDLSAYIEGCREEEYLERTGGGTQDAVIDDVGDGILVE